MKRVSIKTVLREILWIDQKTRENARINRVIPHILSIFLDAQQYVIYTFQVILHSYGVFIIDCLFEA